MINSLTKHASSHIKVTREVATSAMDLKQANPLQIFISIIIFISTGYSRHHQNLRHPSRGYCDSHIREDRRSRRR